MSPGGGAPFDREQVNAVHGHLAADQFSHEIVTHDVFCKGKHPRRGRVIAGQNSGRHLVQECRSRKTELVTHIGERPVEEGDARYVAICRHEAAKPSLDSFFERVTAHSFWHVGGGPFGLLQREQAELEEAVTRDCRQEVRITAAGVKHRSVGVTGGQAHELVLKLERAQLRQLGVIDSLQEKVPSQVDRT